MTKLTPSQIKLALYILDKEIKQVEQKLGDISENGLVFWKSIIKDLKALKSFVDPAGVFTKKEGF